ncbi:hypothetical protein G1C95_2399 [Bifidobacterium sp. DSM 109957]|uniref:Uncharacterized protein n=1 Tax=Bifidobacterium oedipodis TaxID=2675322 RepID=A0A7Y0ERR9_9BIFI|nr:hypothetical protein [Bifidobacterium sp. DSM 109957]
MRNMVASFVFAWDFSTSLNSTVMFVSFTASYVLCTYCFQDLLGACVSLGERCLAVSW